MSAKIAIVGAGPAGLTLGRLLSLQNIECTIFERDVNFAELAGRQGGCLDIHATSGQRALGACGLMEQFRVLARYDAQELKVTDSQGEVLMHKEYDGISEKSPEIDRRQLRELLLDSVPADKIRWGSVISSIERADDGTMVIVLDGGEKVAGFDLVIGADGAWSKVRKLSTQATPQYSGFYYLQSEIVSSNENFSRIAAQIGAGSIVCAGSAKQIAAQRMADGTINTYVCLPLPEHWHKTNREYHFDPNEFRSKLLENEFVDWAEGLKDIVRHSEGPLYAWPLYAMPIDAFTWRTTPGVALIGDAAHVSTPFVGEGVNCSMHDSLQLAQAIAKHGTGNLNEAVAEYEAQMFPRAVDLITRSNQSKDLVLAVDAPNGFKEMLNLPAKA